MIPHEGASPGEEDRRRQQCVLQEALELFPIRLTVEETVRTQATQRLGDQDPEPWEQAITELRRAGLVRQEGAEVVPTIAAIRAWQLLD